MDVAALTSEQKDLRRKTHQTIAKISDDIGRRYTFNTAVAAAMELLNAINKFDDESSAGGRSEQEALEAVVLMLSPMVPHICHELWSALGHETPLIDMQWPELDEQALRLTRSKLYCRSTASCAARISVAADADNDSVAAQALADPNVQKHIEDKEIRKTIVVPGRLVNIVV